MIKGFADIVIADFTAGQINHCFTEIAPHTVYPQYGIVQVLFRVHCYVSLLLLSFGLLPNAVCNIQAWSGC